MDLNDTQDSDVEMEITTDLNQGYTPVIDLGYNTVDTTWDAGAYLLGSIGDYVFLDNNRNGIQDEGDTFVADSPVTLHIKKVTVDGTTESVSYTHLDVYKRQAFWACATI